MRPAPDRASTAARARLARRLEADAERVRDALGTSIAMVAELDESLRAELSAHVPDDAPVLVDGLVQLRVRHRRPDGLDGFGRMILPRHASAGVLATCGVSEDHTRRVAAAPDRVSLVDHVLALFREGHASGELVLDRVAPWHWFAETAEAEGRSTDAVAMAWNATSAFQPRRIGSSGRWSRHTVGAIDLNPLQNPAIVPVERSMDWRGATVDDARAGRVTLDPPEGLEFAFDRPTDDPRVLHADSFATRFLVERGWSWGGDWTSLGDPQHFSYGVE